MMGELSRGISHETRRARPVRGGKASCCWAGCTAKHAPGSGYCDAHKAEYMRGWRKRKADKHKAQAEELARLRALEQQQGQG